MTKKWINQNMGYGSAINAAESLAKLGEPNPVKGSQPAEA